MALQFCTSVIQCGIAAFHTAALLSECMVDDRVYAPVEGDFRRRFQEIKDVFELNIQLCRVHMLGESAFNLAVSQGSQFTSSNKVIVDRGLEILEPDGALFFCAQQVAAIKNNSHIVLRILELFTTTFGIRMSLFGGLKYVLLTRFWINRFCMREEIKLIDCSATRLVGSNELKGALRILEALRQLQEENVWSRLRGLKGIMYHLLKPFFNPDYPTIEERMIQIKNVLRSHHGIQTDNYWNDSRVRKIKEYFTLAYLLDERDADIQRSIDNFLSS